MLTGRTFAISLFLRVSGELWTIENGFNSLGQNERRYHCEQRCTDDFAYKKLATPQFSRHDTPRTHAGCFQTLWFCCGAVKPSRRSTLPCAARSFSTMRVCRMMSATEPMCPGSTISRLGN